MTLHAPKPASSLKRPAIMVQGTCSNAGKSLIAAGICRALRQDGLAVAPFKAQNMSLNSGVTANGLEMGRAQILQAQACGMAPDVRMNPVLLKPNSTTGSQVIVMGRPRANMEARSYFQFKPQLFEEIATAYDSLAQQADVLVLEGAGSPAEINLKAHDVVNMRMAAYAGAAVLLVADIDRGGAFAALIGTMECLEPWERKLVAGFVLNKFRGDASLLGDALDFTTQRTSRPFFGVLPWLNDLGLPDEDSVSLKQGALANQPNKLPDSLDVACLDLPHISNATDLDALAAEPDVALRLVRTAEQLGPPWPDAVIIPGSKATLADLEFLRAAGLGNAIAAAAEAGVDVVGVCGGYQMLGVTVADPQGVEAAAGSRTAGLGLLPLVTEIMPEKTLVRSTFTHVPSGLAAHGYEIHHGRTTLVGAEADAVFIAEDGQAAGYAGTAGSVWGTYLHGLFDADQFRGHWLDGIRRRRGLPALGQDRPCYDIEPALDRLAEAVRTQLDWPAICKTIDK